MLQQHEGFNHKSNSPWNEFESLFSSAIEAHQLINEGQQTRSFTVDGRWQEKEGEKWETGGSHLK